MNQTRRTSDSFAVENPKESLLLQAVSDYDPNKVPKTCDVVIDDMHIQDDVNEEGVEKWHQCQHDPRERGKLSRFVLHAFIPCKMPYTPINENVFELLIHDFDSS